MALFVADFVLHCLEPAVNRGLATLLGLGADLVNALLMSAHVFLLSVCLGQ